MKCPMIGPKLITKVVEHLVVSEAISNVARALGQILIRLLALNFSQAESGPG